MKKTILKAISWATGSLLVASIVWAAYGWRVDNAGNIRNMNAQMAGLSVGETSNCGWFRESGTITIKGSNGDDLSSANPCCIGVPSATTSGENITLCKTANITFNDADHVSSDLTHMTFGVTSSVAWGVSTPMPVFIYAVNKDNTAANLRIAISRDPTATSFPTADIGDTDHAPGTPAQTNAFFAGTHFTVADYNNKPAALIGATSMWKATTAVDWTLRDTYHFVGIGQRAINFITQYTYDFPPGQNGGETVGGIATYLTSSGLNGANDVPTWANNQGTAKYSLGLDGLVEYSLSTRVAGNCTNGDKAVILGVASPYAGGYFYTNDSLPIGSINISGSNYTLFGVVSVLDTTGIIYLFASTLGNVEANDFSTATDMFNFKIIYKAF